VPVLKHALGTSVGYIGLLGSSRRGAAILNLLREDGAPEDQLTRVRVPIGLDLGAQSAPEIALSIMSEILLVQRNATGMANSEKVRKGLK
jgi:xanthine dehydrogenase accessory factor